MPTEQEKFHRIPPLGETGRIPQDTGRSMADGRSALAMHAAAH